MKGKRIGQNDFLTCWPAFLSRTQGPFLDGKEVSGMSEGARDRLRAESIGYVFQSFNLLQVSLAWKTYCLRRLLRECKSLGPRSCLTGLVCPESDYIRQLSIGQQQRVALARALANNLNLFLRMNQPGILILKTAKRHSPTQELCRENGSSLLLVSHEEKVIESFEIK